MPLKDRLGLPVTCAVPAAVEDYVAAVDLLLSAWPGAEVLLDRALAADPEFALAHIARARLLQLQARMPEAKAPAGRAAIVAGARRVRAAGVQRAPRSSRGAAGAARRIGAALGQRLVVSRLSRLGLHRNRRGCEGYPAGRALARRQPAQCPCGASARPWLF